MDVFDPNWGWIPWKQAFVLAGIAFALVAWCGRTVRAAVRRGLGRPVTGDERTARRDAWVARVRELDEPYLRRERTTVRD